MWFCPGAGVMQNREHFRTLDLLRSIAALGVAARHTVAIFGGPAINRSGLVGVDFFFILSGFVIAHAYRDRLQSDLSAKRFIIGSAVRLYPPS